MSDTVRICSLVINGKRRHLKEPLVVEVWNGDGGWMAVLEYTSLGSSGKSRDDAVASLRKRLIDRIEWTLDGLDRCKWDIKGAWNAEERRRANRERDRWLDEAPRWLSLIGETVELPEVQ
jgi:hypothetical protein